MAGNISNLGKYAHPKGGSAAKAPAPKAAAKPAPFTPKLPAFIGAKPKK